MKSKLLLLFVLVTLTAYAQETAFTIGTKFQQHSAILNEDYSVYVSLPRNYDKNTGEKFPVLYLLDGSGYLTFVSEAVKMLSTKNGNGVSGMPECIVVGLTSNNRERDMTPPQVQGWAPPSNPLMDMSKIKWGGADNFLEHIQKEVMPYIEKNYRTQPYRILVGHSLGGLLAFHAMVTRPKMFQSFIIGDPSVWWNDGHNMRTVMKYWKEHPDEKFSLALFRPEVPREYWFPINVEFYNYLNTKPKNVFFKYVELKDELHGTVVFPGVYLSLRDLYKGYRYKMNPDASIEEAQHHYDSLSNAFGYKIPVSEELIKVLQEIKEMQKKGK